MIEIHESTGSYAVDALEPPELAEFEAHLATCRICSKEVCEFCETVAELTLLTEATPPSTLRDKILCTIRKSQRPAADDRIERLARPATSRPAGPGRAQLGSKLSDEQAPPPVNRLALRRLRRRSRVLTGLVAASLALVVGLGGVVYSQYLERQAQIAQANWEKELYHAPDARVVVADLAKGGQASFVVSKQLNRALFIGTELPDPGPSNRYQLWIATGSSLQELTGVFPDNQVSERGSGTKLFLRGDIAHADFLAVTIEPAGAIPAAPTTDVLGAGEI